MELLLELRYPAGGAAGHADVRVDIDPEDTVAALTEALSNYARQRGYGPGWTGSGLYRAGVDRPLDPSARVVDTGLVSGETVSLADAPIPEPLLRDHVPPPPPAPTPAPADPYAPPPAPGAVPPGPPGPGMPPGAPPAPPGVAPPPPPPPPPVPAPPTQVVRGSGQASPGDLRSTGGLTLDVTAGPGVGRVIPLHRDVIVGRAETCTVVIDDPTMSREHFAVRITNEGQVFVVPNPAATNGTFIGGVQLEEPREVELGEEIQAGSSIFAVRSAVSEETRRRDRMGQVPFNRIPYRRTVVWPQQLPEVAPPPDTPSDRKLGLAACLMPLVSAGAMAFFFGSYYFLGIAAISPLMLIYRHFSSKRGGKKSYRRERAAYYERVEAAAAALDEALERERQTRLTAAPDLAELARQAMLHQPRLWERNRLAGDLLDLRLGLGELESEVTVEIPGTRGDEQLRAEGVQRLAHQRTVTEVPITVNLLEKGIMGLWGDPAQVSSSGRALIAQAACLHSPEDLVVVAAVGPNNVTGFEWLKWLPHVRSATSPLEGDHLAVGPDATRGLLINLLGVAADRGDRSDPSGMQVWPRVLLVLDEMAEPDRALLSQLLDIAPVFGIHVIWLGESELQVPRQCQAIVACPGKGYPGRVRFTDPTLPDRMVELDGAQPDTARSIARSLAPLRDASAASQTTAIPRIVPLFDVVGFDKPTPEAIVDRWRVERPYGLQFPIGMSAEGVFDLDLVEQGPHTLIGGTSGAGKSELLQTLVLSLAANYSPNQLNFLFVDYKGGASSAEFRDLPHTVGYVTNLSGSLSLRALTSLRAELQRRMQLMEGKAKDLREMLAVDPENAPPSLVIVVDEFAALVKEIPDFVAGIVDIAQRGRSLGVHLILATQRPTGVVNENILANTNLRISLRMLDPADSNNIIGTRDAADIPVPLRGRAYARTGPQALVPFQCAWSGAPFSTDEQVRAVTIRAFNFLTGEDGGDGASAAPAGPASKAPEDEPPTQLEVLVRVCADAARAQSLPPARRPWVEPLGDVIPLSTVLDRVPPGELERDPGRVAVLGLYDDPANQAQQVAAVDLETSGGLVVFGTGGSGKTTLLRTVALGMVRQGSPDDVQLYVLDFASRSLDALGDLPHCAAVVAGEDVERTARLLTVLEREIDQRRDALATARAENLGALRMQSGASVFPRIILLLDSYSGFHSTFDRSDRFTWVNRFQGIVSAGRQVGIHTVMTTERRMGMPPALLSSVSARLVLRMATADEMAGLGVPAKVAKDAELPNGRSYLDGSTEVQVACVSDDPSGMVQSNAIAEAAVGLRRTTVSEAPGLPDLPASFELDPTEVPSVPPLHAPLGQSDLTLATVEVDLGRQNMVVLGPPLSGKSTALETIAAGLRASSGSDVQLCVLGSPASPLRDLPLWDDSAFTRSGHAGVVERLTELLADDEGLEVRAVLFVDAAEDVEGNDVLRPLEALTKHDGLRFVVASDPGTLSKAYSGWLSGLRRNRAGLLLQPETKADVEAALGLKPDLRPNQDFPPGRGIFAANRRWQLVQVGQRPPSSGARRTGDVDPRVDDRQSTPRPQDVDGSATA